MNEAVNARTVESINEVENLIVKKDVIPVDPKPVQKK